jgi:MFS family permease
MSAQRRDQGGLRALNTVVREKRFQRWTLPRRSAFWLAAAIAFLVFAANSAASPLYHVYEAQFRFSATTLTALFVAYILVLLVTLLFFGSLSDYVGRRVVIAAGLVAGTASCVLFLIAHGVGTLFAARALQGLSTGLISGAASATLLDLRPCAGAAVLSSAAPTGGQAWARSVRAHWPNTPPRRLISSGGCSSAPSSSASWPCWQCERPEPRDRAPVHRCGRA